MKEEVKAKLNKLGKEVDEILEVVYEKGQEGLDKDRTLFYNSSNLKALILELVESIAK